MAAHPNPNASGPKGRGENPKAQEKSYQPGGGTPKLVGPKYAPAVKARKGM